MRLQFLKNDKKTSTNGICRRAKAAAGLDVCSLKKPQIAIAIETAVAIDFKDLEFMHRYNFMVVIQNL